MQPLIEHRRHFAGFDTRVLELEGVAELLLGFPALLRRAAYASEAQTVLTSR